MALHHRFPHLARLKITPRHAASAVAVAASVFFSASQLRNDELRQERDLELSSALLADGLRAAVEPRLAAGDDAGLHQLSERFGRRGRLAGIAVFDAEGGIVTATRSLEPHLHGPPRAAAESLARGVEASGYETFDGTRMKVSAVPLRARAQPAGVLAVFHDSSFIEARQARTSVTSLRRMAVQAVLFLAAVWLFGLFFK